MNYFTKFITFGLLIASVGLLETKADELPKPEDIPAFMLASYEKNKLAFLENVFIVAERIGFDEKENPAAPNARYTYKGGNQRFLFSEDIFKFPDYKYQFWVGGPEGFFAIEKKPDQAEGKILDKLSPTVKHFHGICRGDSGVGLQLATHDIPYHTYLILPDLKIESVKLEKWEGEDLACISTKRSLKGGVWEKFYFDQNHDWVFRGSKRTTDQGKGGAAIYEVFYKEDGVTPLRWESKIKKPDGSIKLTGRLNIVQYQKRNFPDSDFSLTQFGLPDPTNNGINPNRYRYLWWLLAAGVLASLAILFRHLSNKSNTQSHLIVQPGSTNC